MINNDYSSPWSPLFYFVNRYSNPQDLVAVLTARQQTVERFMQTVRWTESDIDLFVYGLESEAAANRKVMALLAKITKNAKAAGAQDVVYIKTPNTITLDAGRRFRKVQIITRLYSAKADVLNTFDIDCCGFGYDGSDCWFVNRAGVAMNQKVNIVDLTLRGAAYEHRLTKYATRGFAVGVPGLDKSDIIDANYFKVKSEANSWGGTSFVGDGWSWNKWQECTGTLERLLLNEAIGKSEGYLENPFPGRLRKEVFPADKVKHFSSRLQVMTSTSIPCKGVGQRPFSQRPCASWISSRRCPKRLLLAGKRCASNGAKASCRASQCLGPNGPKEFSKAGRRSQLRATTIGLSRRKNAAERKKRRRPRRRSSRRS